MFRINLLGLDIYGCREALERLDDYLDRELSHEEQRKVGQHLKICHECARKFAFEHDLVNGLREKTQHVALPRISRLFLRASHRLCAKKNPAHPNHDAPSTRNATSLIEAPRFATGRFHVCV
jgi:hypothetical protein